jgi:hypothetical protein
MSENLAGLAPWLAWFFIGLGGGIGGVAKYCLYRHRMPYLRLVKDIIIGLVAAFVGVLVFPFDLSTLITHNLLLKLFSFSLLAGVAGNSLLATMNQDFLDNYKTIAHKEYTKRIDEIERRLRGSGRKDK